MSEREAEANRLVDALVHACKLAGYTWHTQEQTDAVAAEKDAARSALLQRLTEADRFRDALRVIAGELPCADYLLGHADVARIALHGASAAAPPYQPGASVPTGTAADRMAMK